MSPTNAANADFTFPVRVYWEDTDAGGIVFYANYLKFFERARTEWLRSLGIGQQRLREDTCGMFVVSETNLKYHRPARLDDLLHVTATVQEIGRVSMLVKQSVLLNQEQLCTGSIRIGWVDAASLKPARIPAMVLAALQSTSPH